VHFESEEGAMNANPLRSFITPEGYFRRFRAAAD
jgi:hypothetical protein